MQVLRQRRLLIGMLSTKLCFWFLNKNIHQESLRLFTHNITFILLSNVALGMNTQLVLASIKRSAVEAECLANLTVKF
jgi:hypothetical protein